MSDAPERIWADPWSHGNWGDYGLWNINQHEKHVEYIRADLHEALRAENERYRAALIAFRDFDDLPTLHKRPDVFELRVRRKILAALNERKEDE